MALPPFHNGQKLVYHEMKRFNLLVAGRRWRKTTFGSAYLTRFAWLNPGEYMWGSPTHDQNKIALANIERILQGKKCKVNHSSMTVDLPDSTIYLRSMHKPDNVRGFTIHGVVIDEGAYINPDAWTEVLRPTLMDTFGWSLNITTPNGDNYIKDMFDKGNRENSSVWRIPSYGVSLRGTEITREPHKYENPELHFEEIKSLLETMDSISFRQEIMAEFLNSGLNPFTNIDILCSTKQKEQWPMTCVAGLDLAKTTDYSVLSIIDKQTRREVYLHKFPHMNYTDQVPIITELCKRFNVSVLSFDVTGVGQAVGEMLYNSSLGGLTMLDPFTFNNASKTDLINKLVLSMEQKNIWFTDNDEGIYQFRKFKREQFGNTIRFEGSEGAHDDIVIARSLANRASLMGGLFA